MAPGPVDGAPQAEQQLCPSTRKPWCHSKQTRVLFDPSLSVHAAMAMSLCRVISIPALLFRRATRETPEQPSMFHSGTCLREEQNLIAGNVVEAK